MKMPSLENVGLILAGGICALGAFIVDQALEDKRINKAVEERLADIQKEEAQE